MARSTKSTKAEPKAEVKPDVVADAIPDAQPETPLAPLESRLDDAVAQALAAAEAALNSSEEVAKQAASMRKELEAAQQSQKRAATLTLSGVGIGVVVLALGGLVYMRSVADLREAADTMGSANEVMVQHLIDFGKSVTTLEEVQKATEDGSKALTEKIDGAVQSLTAAAGTTPDLQAAVKAGLADSLDGLKADLLAANSELEMSLTQTLTGQGADGTTAATASLPPDVVQLLQDVRDALDKVAKMPKAEAASPAPKASAKPATKSGSGKASSPKSRPAAASDNPFHFP